MNLLFFIRLLIKHIVLLIILPVALAVMVIFLTRNQPKVYTSSTSIYTGITTGSSIVSMEDSKVDLFATRTAFDNLINIINARSTMEEVGLRLLATHLMLEKPVREIISPESYRNLMEMVPDEVKKLVVKDNFEITLENLKNYKNSDYNNFIYRLINYEHPHYSSKKIQSKTKVRRVLSSDIIEIIYQSNDQGICKNTLEIMTEVFIHDYTNIKVNQTDAVVHYFQTQLDLANTKLNEAENELLEFNQTNTIINYYEQTKHIAAEKELFDMRHLEIKLTNAAAASVLKVLENKLTVRERQRINNETIASIRRQLAQINLDIAFKSYEEKADSASEQLLVEDVAGLRTKAYELEQQLKQEVLEQYYIDNTTEGLPTESILQEWIDKVIEFEATKAQLKVAEIQILEFDRLFESYAPLGATMKRLERKIDVAEREYLSLLHSLSVAKLNQQSIELNSNLKTVTPPLFPIVSEPGKRKFLVFIAFLIGFVIPAFLIIVLEFLDQNIKTAQKAENVTGLKVAAIFPNLSDFNKKLDIEFIKKRGLDIITRRLLLNKQKNKNKNTPCVNLFFSIQEAEGKTTLSNLVIEKLKAIGYSILFLTDKPTILIPGVVTKTYSVNNAFHKYEEISDLLEDLNDIRLNEFDYIFLEIPGILYHTCPMKLFNKIDSSFLVTRANRAWTKADNNAVKDIIEFTGAENIQILLNGVAMQEMESVLGDLPRKRSRLRMFIKNIIRLQFFSKTKFS